MFAPQRLWPSVTARDNTLGRRSVYNGVNLNQLNAVVSIRRSGLSEGRTSSMFGRDEKVSPMRLTAAQYIILAIFLVLTYGLWRLQVSRNDLYATLAEKNRVRDVPILAPRCKILDREGRVIVDNYSSFSALLMRDSTRNLNDDADIIAQGLQMDAKDIKDRIRRFASMPQYQPIFLKDDITQDDLAFIEAHRNELPELDTIMAHRRLYPRKGFMAHVI